VDPVPEPLLIRKSGSAGNRTRTCGSVARKSDHHRHLLPDTGLVFWTLTSDNIRQVFLYLLDKSITKLPT
jgi:hypothetical protein